MFNLFLDDSRPGPHNAFGTPEVGWENWVIVRNVENAKRLLEADLVDDMSLDHDLGYNSEHGGENPNGKALVLWMVETGHWPRGKITLHSAHYTRAVEMKELIDRYRPNTSETGSGD